MTKPAKAEGATEVKKVFVVALCVAVWPAFGQEAPPQAAQPQASVAPAPATPSTSTATAQPVPPGATDLHQVKRILVENFGDDPISRQIQAMVVTALTESKRFVVTENKDRADAVLKGSGLEKTSQEVHTYSDSTAVGGASGGHSGNMSGSWHDGTGHVSGSSAGGFISRSAGISDSSLNTETINDARIAVRLVNRDGDVIWATTQESKGAKYKGASADVAEKVVKQLLRDAEKSAKKQEPASTSEKTETAAQTK